MFMEVGHWVLGQGSLGGGEDRSRPSGVGKERASEDVETESGGITILRSLMQRVVAEIGKLEKDTEHRDFLFFYLFFNTREADGRREGEAERWERTGVSVGVAPRAAERRRASAEQKGPSQLPWHRREGER